eukprot:comp4764_c0_seq1/m.899 comp4764_c0_seq1/g.899  ORF comp4764_c0_seq1/g.899 comp4764_c0_seq1/m.899 type:complete len:327 (-) comp4764_c0_seq1:236-1216(-)
MAPPQNFQLNQTMMRIKDPAKSIPFYTEHFGMTLIAENHYPDAKFSLYFLITLPEGQVAPPIGTEEAKKYMHSGKYGVTLELTHNHGTESDPDFKYHNGNSDPRGFGHIGFLVDDLHGFCSDLEAKGVAFKKRPNEGNMHNLAFAFDPDGYWVEIIQKSSNAVIKGRPTFQQTMLRIKDPTPSLKFYTEVCGMTLIDELPFPQWQFTIYFLAHLTEEQKKSLPAPGTEEAHDYVWSFPGTTLELTHNHGTEKGPEFKYDNGNVEPHRGFGHIAFMVDDVYAACEYLETQGVSFQKKPNEGRMKGLAFALDPDGYWVEIVKRSADAY